MIIYIDNMTFMVGYAMEVCFFDPPADQQEIGYHQGVRIIPPVRSHAF